MEAQPDCRRSLNERSPAKGGEGSGPTGLCPGRPSPYAVPYQGPFWGPVTLPDLRQYAQQARKRPPFGRPFSLGWLFRRLCLSFLHRDLHDAGSAGGNGVLLEHQDRHAVRSDIEAGALIHCGEAPRLGIKE